MVSKRVRNRKSPPPTVRCGNPKCDATLMTSDPGGLSPNEETPPERIHWALNQTSSGPFTIFCGSCGHFTKFSKTPPPGSRYAIR
jgi:hypothetical protein